jgi:hypothetical protein
VSAWDTFRWHARAAARVSCLGACVARAASGQRCERPARRAVPLQMLEKEREVEMGKDDLASKPEAIR